MKRFLPYDIFLESAKAETAEILDVSHTDEYFEWFMYSFNVSMAYRLIEANKIKYTKDTIPVKSWAVQMLNVDNYELVGDVIKMKENVTHFNLGAHGIILDHVNKMGLDVLKKPCLTIVLNDSHVKNQGILIDGNHRLFKAYFFGVKEIPTFLIRDMKAINLFMSSPFHKNKRVA